METQQQSTREIVIPGTVISTAPGLIPGRGAIRTTGDEIISLFVGLKEIRGKYVNVVPLKGLYNPQMGDKVIARVRTKTPVKYLMEINSKYVGILKPMDAFKRNSRGRGYGKSAFRKMLSYIPDTHPCCEEIRLTVEKDNTIAQELYQSMEFDSTGETNKYDEIIYTFPVARNHSG